MSTKKKSTLNLCTCLIFFARICFGQQGSAYLNYWEVFTVPQGVTQLTVELMGRGGYGGTYGGGGGGGGGFAKGVYTVIAGSTIQVTYYADTTWLKPWMYVTGGASGRSGTAAINPGKGGSGGTAWGGNITNGFGGDGGSGNPLIFGGGGGGAAGIFGNGFNGDSAPGSAPSASWTGSAGGGGGGGMAGRGGKGGIQNYGSNVAQQGKDYGAGGGGSTNDYFQGSGVAAGYCYVSWGTCYTPPTPALYNYVGCRGLPFDLTTAGYEPIIWISDTINNNALATGPLFHTSPFKMDTFFYLRSVGECGNMSPAKKYHVFVMQGPDVSASLKPDKVCYGSSYTISATGADTYSINNKDFSITPVLTNTNSSQGVLTTSVVVKGSWQHSSNFCIGSDTIWVTLYNKPEFNGVLSKTNCCTGDTVQFMGSGPAISAFKWSNGASGFSTSVIVPDVPKYWVTITDTNKCSQTFDLQLKNVSPQIKAYSSATISCAGEAVELYAQGNASFYWNTGQTGTVITVMPDKSTIYTVTGTSGDCTSKTTVFHSVNDCTGLHNESTVADYRKAEKPTLYPNPCFGDFVIRNFQGPVTIINMKGEIVLDQKNNPPTFKLRLPTGIYFVLSGNITHKLVVLE